MNRVKKMIHLEYAYKLGLTGEGVTVAVMDTGIAIISPITKIINNKATGIYETSFSLTVRNSRIQR